MPLNKWDIPGFLKIIQNSRILAVALKAAFAGANITEVNIF